MYIKYQGNPLNRNTNDSFVRALSKVMGIDWDTAYTELSIQGLCMAFSISSMEYPVIR